MNAGLEPGRRGYSPLYRTGTACPGCGASQWEIGRFSAECCFCCTALPIAPPAAVPAETGSLPGWATRP